MCSYHINKKSAMFGLDARIALAIFGALSIISGAALYGILQHIEVVKIINESHELAKAWEQYYLDTGKMLPANHWTAGKCDSPNKCKFLLQDLISNNANVANWKGPYIQRKISNISYPGSFLKYGSDDTNDYIYMALTRHGSTFQATWDSFCLKGTTPTCDVSVTFFVYNDINVKFANKIDKMIDNGDGFNVGNFRYWASTSINQAAYTFIFHSIKNPSN